VEETKTREKRIIIENGNVVPSLQNYCKLIKNANISDEEKVMILDACSEK
jgi:hypothetical protein